MKSQHPPYSSLESSPKQAQKDQIGSKFKIDLPNIRKNSPSPHQEDSQTYGDRFSKLSSDRISSLIKLIKKSKSNTKILKNSPYCNIPYKNQLISYIKEKEQKSMHSRRSPNQQQLELDSYKVIFVIQFPMRASRSFNAQNYDQYLIDAEACQQGEFICNKKIIRFLSERVEGGQKKFLLKKIIGFSCIEIGQDQILEKLAFMNPGKQNKNNKNQQRKSFDPVSLKKQTYQETISYLLSIKKLSLSAKELKNTKFMILVPVFNHGLNLKRDVKPKPVILSDFTLIKCLGSGGFSTVYLSKCLRNNKYYALKLIDKEFIIETEREAIVSNERFILEKIMEPSKSNEKDEKVDSLRHKFVTHLSFSFETYHHFIFALEFCPGGELFHQLKKVKKMTQEQAKFYFLEILIALDHIHSHGVVYRDLKPENLLIDDEGHIKIADFGLSKPVQDKKDLSYSFCGSPQYMAPQMLCKTGHNYLLDYYCLGALLYELVIGIPPYYSLNQDEIYNSIMTEQLSFPSNVYLSSQIKNLLEGLLNKNMKKRLGSLCGIKQIFFHPWVGKINRSSIENRQLVPPFLPNLMQANFDADDIKSDLQSIDKKLNEDMLIGSQFQSHFTEEFYYENPKEMDFQRYQQEIKIVEEQNLKNKKQRNTQESSGWRKNNDNSSQKKFSGQNFFQSHHHQQNHSQSKQKLCLKRYYNSKGSINQKMYENSHRAHHQSLKRQKNKLCQSTRRFTSQQLSMDRRIRSKEKNNKNRQNTLRTQNQFKSLRKCNRKSERKRQDQNVDERKKKMKAIFTNARRTKNIYETSCLVKKNDSIIREKQYQKNLLEMVKNDSLGNLGKKDIKKLTHQRSKIGKPFKAGKHLRS